MNSLRDLNITNKKVLVRTDFNVSLKDGQIVDDFRIRASLPTIKKLLEKKAKIILISHLARPAGHREREYTLKPIAQRLSALINQPVQFLDDCLGQSVQEAVNQMQPGQIILLENLRFYPEEENNHPEFAKQLASLAEIYINDAFGVSHRAHTSIVGLPQYLPNCAGLLLEKEIKVLSQILESPQGPLVVIIGGVKISTKLKVIKNFLAKVDHLCLGGALANTILRAQGIAVGQSLVEEEMLGKIKELNLTDTKLHLPVDVVTSLDSQNYTFNRIAPVGGTEEKEVILDIGPETRELFSSIIQPAKTIVWNGPMGFFEIEEFAQGTKAIAEAVAQSGGFSVVGGGETITFLDKLGLSDKISHLSTGGGAMLQFLAGQKLPGIEALG